MWGCTAAEPNTSTDLYIVPTYVGVYRKYHRMVCGLEDCPHVCGGVPYKSNTRVIKPKLSPRMWGCTGEKCSCVCDGDIVPTYVGVYRVWYHKKNAKCELSPRMWGCTGKCCTQEKA